MDKQNRPTFPYRPPNLLVLKWAKKTFSPAFANLWLLLVLLSLYCEPWNEARNELTSPD